MIKNDQNELLYINLENFYPKNTKNSFQFSVSTNAASPKHKSAKEWSATARSVPNKRLPHPRNPNSTSTAKAQSPKNHT